MRNDPDQIRALIREHDSIAREYDQVLNGSGRYAHIRMTDYGRAYRLERLERCQAELSERIEDARASAIPCRAEDCADYSWEPFETGHYCDHHFRQATNPSAPPRHDTEGSFTE